MKNLLFILPLLLVGCMSPQAMDAVVRGWDDYQMCYQYFSKVQYAARSQEHRYPYYKSVVAEKERRQLDCKMFPEFKNKKPFMEERVRLYEEQGSW